MLARPAEVGQNRTLDVRIKSYHSGIGGLGVGLVSTSRNDGNLGVVLAEVGNNFNNDG